MASDAMKPMKRSGYFWHNSACPSFPIRAMRTASAVPKKTSIGGEPSEIS
jgi:hypothetical protein